MSAILSAHKQFKRNSAYRGAAINMAARGYRGDPGIFDSIWSGIKGAVGGFISGGPAGAIAGGAIGLASGNKGKPVNPSVTGSTGLIGSALTQIRAQQQQRLALAAPADVNIFSPGSSNQLPPMMAAPGGGNTTQGGTVGTDWNDRRNGQSAACQRGYHSNKSDYFTKKYGFIPKGSVCVKNRRRNPLNPRALSRAMSRLSSAKNAAKFLGRVSIRPSHGCGCK